MQRFFSPSSRTYLTGVVAAVGLGLVGAGVRAVSHRGGLTPVPSQKPAPLAVPAPKSETTVKIGKPEVGKASWYGEEFQGKTTANGEKFDSHSLTCAHRTLPLGSLLRVTNLRNRKTVMVRVNDRGPMLEDRVLDLSMAAARKIGLFGLGKVSIQPVKKVSPNPADAKLAAQATKQVTISEASRFEPFPFLHHT